MRLIDGDALEMALCCAGYKHLKASSGQNADIPVREAMDICEAAPTIDAVKVVRCCDCKYWQKPHVLLPDGTRRDYLPGEVNELIGLPGVSADVGINVGGYCDGYWLNGMIANGRHLWAGEDFFCANGLRRRER